MLTDRRFNQNFYKIRRIALFRTHEEAGAYEDFE